MGAAAGATKAAAPSFYRKPLPSPPAVAFASVAGQRLLREALAGSGGALFFKLMEQFSTQSEPAYCGLGTLVVILNALSIDPGRQWKGPWRWFSEELLDCCEPLESIAAHGITIDRFACLAACNGATAVVQRAVESGKRSHSSGAGGEAEEPSELRAFRETVRAICAGETPPAAASGSCCGGGGGGGGGGSSNTQTQKAGDGCCAPAGRNAGEAANQHDGHPSAFLAVSYSRAALEQAGGGHFSPVGAYHAESDQVLILDVARFKYPPHWVPLPLLWKAMLLQDHATGLARGYVVLTRSTRRTGGGWESQQLRVKLLPTSSADRCASQSPATRASLLLDSVSKVYATLQDPLAATLRALSSQAFRVEFRDAPVCVAGVAAAKPTLVGLADDDDDADADERSRREIRDELDRFALASCSKALASAFEGSVAAGQHESAGLARAHLLAVPRSLFIEAGDAGAGWRDALVAELPDTTTMSSRLQDEVEALQRQFTEACCLCPGPM